MGVDKPSVEGLPANGSYSLTSRPPMSSNTLAHRAVWARRLSASACLSLTDPNFAGYLDSIACPGGMRSEFRLPRKDTFSSSNSSEDAPTESVDCAGSPEGNPSDLEEANACVYLCGNSLGLQNKRVAEMLLEELDVWADRAVKGHSDHPYDRNWKDLGDLVNPILASLVGATPAEVACNGSLTTNLHLLMTTFYRPNKDRYKILFEARCFSSDMYAFASQAELHGLNPEEALLKLSPRPGEFYLRTEDILETIHREGNSIALILFPGVQFYTGQAFPIEQITSAGHQHDCIVGFDLAHSMGNVPMELHAWKVDFACWCSYKYLNAGPGAIAGLFVHETWFTDPSKLGGPTGRPRLAGWFGHNPASRFPMPEKFDPMPGAAQFVHSNPDILSLVTLYSSLQIFASYPGGMAAIRTRSEELTGYLEICLQSLSGYIDSSHASEYDGHKAVFTIITPALPAQRGSQLSLMFFPRGKGVVSQVFAKLIEAGVVGDEREPDVIRLAPAALYNTFEDCRKACEVLESVMKSLTVS